MPTGFCQCGCGQPTRNACRTNARLGWVKGQPVKYARGHNKQRTRQPVCCEHCGNSFLVEPGRLRRYNTRWCSRACRRVAGWNDQLGMSAERFWSKVDRTATCWLWTGRTDRKGYGRVGFHRRQYLAHVFAYMLLVGSVPSGLELDHLCRVTSCVRPDHLEAVPHVENVRRGRAAKLTIEKAREIRSLAAGGMAKRAIARQYSIDNSVIVLIVQGKRWIEQAS
jgi:HNH endonuclease